MEKLIPVNNSVFNGRAKSFTVGKRGATFRDGLPFTEWIAFGRSLLEVEDCVQFALGDWINFGERVYGNRYSDAIGALCDSQDDRDKQRWYDYLKRCSWVARCVELCFRKHNLSFQHHIEVSSAAPNRRGELLEQAVRENWTAAQLREAVRADNGSKALAPAKPDFEPLNWALTGVRWFNKQFEVSPIEKWPSDRRALLKKDLEPIVEIYNRL